MKIKGVFWHHTGGTKDNPLASTKHHTAEIIDVSHKDRWHGFTSQVYKNQAGKHFHVGYNFVIEAVKRRIVKTRAIGEETAAAIGYNDGYIHVVFTGNYDAGADVWDANTEALVHNVWGMIKSECPHLTIQQNWPHRKVANKSCFGNSLSDDHIQVILSKGTEDLTISLYKQIIVLLQRQIAMLMIQLSGKRQSSKESG